MTLLSDPEADRPGNRFNDGKCDPWGRFWAGTMAYDFEPLAGALWRVNADFSCVRQRQGLTISNGLAWSQDRGTLYLIDSPTLKVLAFPLTNSGEIAGEPSICVQIPEDWDAVPDGMCIDAEGMLWIALFGGGCGDALGSSQRSTARTAGVALSSGHLLLFWRPPLGSVVYYDREKGDGCCCNQGRALGRWPVSGRCGCERVAGRLLSSGGLISRGCP